LRAPGGIDGRAVDGGRLDSQELGYGSGRLAIPGVAVTAGPHHRRPVLRLVIESWLGARDGDAADDAGEDRERDGEQQVGSASGEGERTVDSEG
jgi:hypothetical protein